MNNPRLSVLSVPGMLEPLTVYHEVIQPGWIDANGHMNLAYYVLVFDRATDCLFDQLDLGDAYRRSAAASVFIAETHTRYEKELYEGEPVLVRSFIFGADDKRLHFGHEMIVAASSARSATQELLGLHVDMKTRRVSPFPPARRGAILTCAQALPDWAGRGMGLPGQL
jgi:acyl-CoA thioester hydrolase